MRNIILVSVAVAAVAAANPIALTFINEFGFDDDGLGWVELHAEPTVAGEDMTGWLLVTSTSVCTFAYTMPDDGFLIVDSASLAGGQYGHGTFRLDPAGDHVRVVPDQMHTEFSDDVEFPVLPPGQGRAPTPPDGGSASVLNNPGAVQTINWYIDSTPTREMDNDDYSTVTGTVTWAPGRNFYEVEVILSGPMGGSVSAVATSGQSYLAIGLGAGRYAATAYGWPGGVRVSYPESVDVGYSQMVEDINIDFDPPGVEEGRQQTCNSTQPAATIIRDVLVLPAPGVERGASSILLDASGRKVLDLHAGANDMLHLPSGVYFVREESQASSHKLQAVRKTVIQR